MSEKEEDFYPLFRQVVKAGGMVTRDDWIRRPIRPVAELEIYGYAEFKKLWKLREKPDGLIVTADFVVRGAILAILELGIQVVPPQMKLVFHRNAHGGVLCPFPVTWAIIDEDLLAEELIQSILRQFKGEKTSPTIIPYNFQRERDAEN